MSELGTMHTFVLQTIKTFHYLSTIFYYLSVFHYSSGSSPHKTMTAASHHMETYLFIHSFFSPEKNSGFLV